MTEIFKTKREYNKKFPSRLFICTNCGALTTSEYLCHSCGWRSDGLLKTMNLGYKYIIKEISDDVHEIFPPLELLTRRN